MQATLTPATQEAVEALYRADGDRIWRAVFAFTQDPDVAIDAVAEAFSQALVRGNAIRSPAAWVWRSAFRIAAGMLKDRSRLVAFLGTESYEMRQPTGELMYGLAQLPARQRAVLVLFYYADYPIRQIANVLQSNVLAVRVNLSRGRKRLRRILGADHA